MTGVSAAHAYHVSALAPTERPDGKVPAEDRAEDRRLQRVRRDEGREDGEDAQGEARAAGNAEARGGLHAGNIAR